MLQKSALLADAGGRRADYWSTQSGAELGETAEAGPQKRPEENHSAGACAGRMILRREQRSEPTGGEPTLRAAQAGRDRDWRRIIRSELAEIE